MSDCFDHELDAFESLDNCFEEGLCTWNHDCSLTWHDNEELGNTHPTPTGHQYAGVSDSDGKIYTHKTLDEEEYEEEQEEDYSDISVSDDGYWIRFCYPEQSSSFNGDHKGKYLIFSEDQYSLIEIALYEIKYQDFECAKVSMNASCNDFVLCLYWHESDRAHELALRYAGKQGLKYRWWKSNEDTRKGKYSNQHKRNSRRKRG